MLYEKSRELTQLDLEHWINNEVFTFGWFLIVGLLIIAYIVWLILLDKSRTIKLLLIGSLAAVAYTLNSLILGSFFGAAEYKIRLFPFDIAIFISSITLAPIIIMLVQQYKSTWKGYLITLFTQIGILEFHNWNVFYHFIVLYIISIVVRLSFKWMVDTQKRHSL
jgi:hypothetical protein